MPSRSKKRLVLLDAHAIIHRAYHALPDFSTSSGIPTGGLYGVSLMILKIATELKPDYMVACFDLPKPTFRHDVYEDYKAGRAEADSELVEQIKRATDLFEAFSIPQYAAEGFEADDLLGTIAEKTKKNKDLEIIIASGDMDTLQLVDGKRVRVYTLRKGIQDTVLYDRKAVIDRFTFPPEHIPDFKALSGDPSDNIIGIKGVGEKTATKLISQFGTIENIYKTLKKNPEKLEEIGIKERFINLLKEGEEEAQFSKTIATIRCDAPITFTLPKKQWGASIDIEKIDEIFEELEFRSLSARVRSVFGIEQESTKQPETEKQKLSEEKRAETCIGAWLLSSDLTDPSEEDVLRLTKKNTLTQAREEIIARIKKENMEKLLYEIELPLVPIVQKAQERGMLIDRTYLERLSKDHHKQLKILEEKIWEHAGREFNINSPQQLGVVLYDDLGLGNRIKKTSTGARSTQESELVKIEEEHEIIKLVLQYREIQKLLSTYIDAIPKLLDEDNRLHTTLLQTGTATGRFASRNPNLQNIPARQGRGEAVRKAFIASEKHRLVAFDYSQIEMRVLAHLSGDETLIDMFARGGDIHAQVASRVFGVKEKEVTKDMRRASKVINFGIVYGMGVNALRVNLGGTRQQAQEFYDTYFTTFPKVATYFDQVKKQVRECGYTETIFGRRRYVGGLRSSLPHIKAGAERVAMNAPIQGTAADLIKIAMVESTKALEEKQLTDTAHLLLQVHDELIYEIGEQSISQAQDIIKTQMEKAARLAVPLEVVVKKGKNWSEV